MERCGRGIFRPNTLQGVERTYYELVLEELETSVMAEYKLGFILSKHILESLPEYENDDQPLFEYLPRIVESVDVDRERVRWAQFWIDDEQRTD